MPDAGQNGTLASGEAPIVPRDHQHRLDTVVPAEAVAILTQCSRAYVENATVVLADRQQQHVIYVDARLTSLAAEFLARSETTSRVLAHTHEAQAAVQSQLDGIYHRLASNVQAFIDQNLQERELSVSEELLNRVAMYANEARAARDESQSTLARVERQLVDAVCKDANGIIAAELAKIQQRVVAKLLEIQTSADTKIARIERRVEAVTVDRAGVKLTANHDGDAIARLGARLGRLRDDFDGEINHIRATISENTSASEERVIMRAQELIHERIQSAMTDARGLFESKIRATEGHLQKIVQDEAARIVSTMSVEQHLQVFREHIDAQVRNATTAMHAHVTTSQLRAESMVTEVLAGQPTHQLTDERVMQLVCERVGVELQEVDERVDKKLDRAQEQMMMKAKQMFEEFVRRERTKCDFATSRAPQHRAASTGDVGARLLRDQNGKYHVFIGDSDNMPSLEEDWRANEKVSHVEFRATGSVNQVTRSHHTDDYFGASESVRDPAPAMEPQAGYDSLWRNLFDLASKHDGQPSSVDSTKAAKFQQLRLQDLEDEHPSAPQHSPHASQPKKMRQERSIHAPLASCNGRACAARAPTQRVPTYRASKASSAGRGEYPRGDACT